MRESVNVIIFASFLLVILLLVVVVANLIVDIFPNSKLSKWIRDNILN